MVDDSEKLDGSRLLYPENIDKATWMVWRISTALHLAVFIRFLQQLHKEDLRLILNHLEKLDDRV